MLAPLALEVLPPTVALNEGLNASLLHSPTWNGVETLCVPVAPFCGWVYPVSVDSVARALQLVGLNKKPCLLIAMLTFVRRTRTPELANPTPMAIRGKFASTVTLEVRGSTLIVARVTIVPRLNGPATAGTAIDIPNGAPL